MFILDSLVFENVILIEYLVETIAPVYTINHGKSTNELMS